jgi:predicted RND superfamily exporter protein
MLVTEDGATTRVSISVPVAGFTRLEPFFERVLETAREIFPETRASITGPYPMVLAAQRSLLSTMVVSLGTTLVIVVAVLLFLVRRRRLELAAVLPNLWPVAAALGLMGWLGVAVDSGTMMIAAVILGLAVDDTLHFLGGLRVANPATGQRSAIRETLIGLAPAHLLTSAILVSGFLVLATSDFLPVARFGAIATAAVTAALTADLIWVPALAARSKADRGGSTGKASHQKESAP